MSVENSWQMGDPEVMKRQEVLEQVKKQFGTEPDYPWADENAVLRHKRQAGAKQRGRGGRPQCKVRSRTGWFPERKKGIFPGISYEQRQVGQHPSGWQCAKRRDTAFDTDEL